MKFLTENLTRNFKNFCEKGHKCVFAYNTGFEDAGKFLTEHEYK